MEATRTPHDTVVAAWAMESLARFICVHGRLPATDTCRKTADMAEADRLMADFPCWDCGAPRENKRDYFCEACRAVRTRESLAGVSR